MLLLKIISSRHAMRKTPPRRGNALMLPRPQVRSRAKQASASAAPGSANDMRGGERVINATLEKRQRPHADMPASRGRQRISTQYAQFYAAAFYVAQRRLVCRLRQQPTAQRRASDVVTAKSSSAYFRNAAARVDYARRHVCFAIAPQRGKRR